MADPDLILLHGALGDAGQLAPLATLMAGARRVTVLELEGHGATPLRGRPLRIESFASAVVEEMDQRGIARPTLSASGSAAWCTVRMRSTHGPRTGYERCAWPSSDAPSPASQERSRR
jgi:pimeloyl-ACP methyl ester carboxylesterase